ncbi:glycosyltransferase [Lysobacter niastensis]|uniref:Glycosyltransferase n=1 Tax=Lysobacter niastensis TaxID=380629 RepID=A0ABS0BC14_9GAMM|nr:glycosyltransferase [Lysobacter niastensis]MBF6025296.1 glycosyltransferase [Lysobacter niastensis]
MDILMLSDVYFPRVNGVSTSIRTYAKALVALGHRVTLVAPDYGEAFDRHATEFGEGFELVRLPARQIFFDPEDRLIRASAMRGTVRELAQRDWDVVHVHTPFRAHQIGVRVGERCNVPVVETCHTHFEEYAAHYLPWFPAGLLRALARGATRRLCHAVDHLIVPTAEMEQVLRGYGVATPSTVLPTGIDLAEFAGGDGDAFRSKHGIRQERPVLATVSRLAVEKNIEFLLRVVQRLVAEFPALLFVIAGEGPDAARLHALCIELGLEAHVRFFGNLDRRGELLDCYRAADAFVFASATETQGLVLIEALALGVPVVSTAILGTATVLRGSHGAVTAPMDEAVFAGTVAQVLRDPQLRHSLAQAGPMDARAWSNDVLIGRVVDLYAGARPAGPLHPAGAGQ